MTDKNLSTEEKVFMMVKLDRSKRRWRLLALLSLIILVCVFFASGNDDKTESVKEDYIAEIKIEGMILADDYRSKKLSELKEDKNVKAVILTIDSPGGSMVPGLEILDELREIAKIKPLVVQMRSIAASAGYLISLSGDYVVANRATLTGSVGVLMPLVDATELSKKLGIKSSEITSGDLKSITSPFSPRSAKAQTYLQNTVNELQKIFLEEVTLKRELTEKQVSIISDGRFVTGQKALDLNLIDAIGNKQTLIAYLQTQKNLDKSLKVEEYSLKKPEKTKWQDILSDSVSSKISNQIEQLFFSKVTVPQMRVQ